MIRRFFVRCARELGFTDETIARHTTYQLAGLVLWAGDPHTGPR